MFIPSSHLQFCGVAAAVGLLCTSGVADGSVRRGPSNAAEPWVFRTVLDERSRVIVAALGDAAWAAWDTEACKLYQVWRPGPDGVKLTGAVYDGEHGPQPSTDGQRYHEESRDAAWFIDAGAPARIQYRGHRFGGPERVSFIYQLALPGKDAEVVVEESPSLGIGRNAVLVRSFRISGLPPSAKISLKLAGERGVWSVSGGVAQLKPAGDGMSLIFTGNGDAKLTGRWALPK